jgi:hypothetical protein
MQHNSDRYINSGESLWCYADRVLCHCPKCERQAIVSKDRIYCLSCTYQEKKYEGKLHGNVLGTPRSWSPHCSTCGYRLLGIRLKAKAIGSQLPKTKSVTCPACKQQTKIDLQWNIDRHSSNAIDPSFGCGYKFHSVGISCGRIMKGIYPISNLILDRIFVMVEIDVVVR